MNRRTVTPLPQLGVIRLSGPDARGFLQGQLSNDLDLLGPAHPLRAGLHTPQGRVIAVLQLIASGADVMLVLPRDLVDRVRAHLARYVLRARLRIEDVSALHAVYGLRDATGRTLQVLPVSDPPPDGEALQAVDWLRADILDGLPQVHAATAEKFIAQMLNLDRVDGISLTKGCYTGQEIIARAHYRGRVKRRMQRFVTQDLASLAPGDRVRLASGATIDVVEVARTPAGTQDFLAVAPLPGIAAAETPAEGPTLRHVSAEPAPLPYALEEEPGG